MTEPPRVLLGLSQITTSRAKFPFLKLSMIDGAFDWIGAWEEWRLKCFALRSGKTGAMIDENTRTSTTYQLKWPFIEALLG
jgi:hypothetical protein